jgi:hypothetical protein
MKGIMKSRPVQGANLVKPKEIRLYTRIIGAMLQDVANAINTYTAKEAKRDYEEIQKRVANEGIAFLTKQLPAFAKAIDKALASDTKLIISGFKYRDGVLPHFLYGLTSLVFTCEGHERSDASVDAVRLLRQIGYCFYKLRLPFDEGDVSRLLENFIDTDANLDFDPDKLSPADQWVLRHARNAIHRVLAPVDPFADLYPRHGPGAVATGEKGTAKGRFKRYYKALALKFPYETHFYYNSSHLCDRLQEYLSLEEHSEPTAKVVLVPKDSRGPRLISMEPLEIQWIQQGLKRKLQRAIETSRLTSGYVNFTRQEVNRDLAVAGSHDGKTVTLDMKDASDRVSLRLVEALFPLTWVEALTAARSTHTLLPDGRRVKLKKFAPMGSATCFPVESLIFWALAHSAASFRRESLSNIAALIESNYFGPDMPHHVWAVAQGDVNCETRLTNPRVYVYGDDIICSTQDYGAILQTLPRFGLMFNEAKCCTGASFRESCGADAFKGEIVTPVRVQARWSSTLSGMEYPSYVSYANSFRKRGLDHAADVLAREIQQVKKTPYSEVDTAPYIALWDPRQMAGQANKRLGIKTRMNPRLHYQELDAWTVRPRIFEDTTAEGWGELLRIAAILGLHPGGPDTSDTSLLSSLVHGSQPWENLDDVRVRAYEYALPRQAVLRRGWTRAS